MMKKKLGLPSLPGDIINVIVIRLPAKSVVGFRCVCKLWLKLLKNHDFIKTHLNHSIENNKYNILLKSTLYLDRVAPSSSYYVVDFDAASASYLSNKAVKIDVPCEFVSSHTCVGSCNGILCFSRHTLFDSVTVCLWNPSTQKYREIVKKSFKGSDVAYGFGYDCKIDDYKLILILDNNSNYYTLSAEIHVYTLGSNSLKKIAGKTLSVYRDTYSSYLLNGAMHWLARKHVVIEDQLAVTRVIVSFDVAEETTKEIQLPSCLLDERYKQLSNQRMGVLGKDLYLSVLLLEDVFELWFMKDYGALDSWTKVLCISQKTENICIWRTLSYFNKNREILFSCNHLQGNQYQNALVSYDLRNGRLTCLITDDMPKTFSAETFIGSLVSLPSSE